MNSKIENKISMWMVLRLFLQGKAAITVSLPGFAALFTLFGTTLDEVLGIMNSLGIIISGFAEEKRTLKTQISTKTAEVAGMIRAYAVMANDGILVKQMTIAKTTLMKMADTVLLAKAQEIYNRAVEMQEDLATYGVSTGLLEGFLTLIGTYNAVMPQPRAEIVDRRHMNEELMNKVNTEEGIVKKIDALVEIKRYSEPQFYSDYWASRKIIELGSRTRALQMWVTDDESGVAVVKAKVTITPNAKSGIDMTKTVKRTGSKGGVLMNSMPAGEYQYEVSFGGYVSEQGSFFVNEGVMTEVSVKMKQVAVPV